MPYLFDLPVDPAKPLDPKDPPPKGWESINFKVEHYGKCASATFRMCADWEQRELRRHQNLTNPDNSPKRAA